MKNARNEEREITRKHYSLAEYAQAGRSPLAKRIAASLQMRMSPEKQSGDPAMVVVFEYTETDGPFRVRALTTFKYRGVPAIRAVHDTFDGCLSADVCYKAPSNMEEYDRKVVLALINSATICDYRRPVEKTSWA